MIWEQNRFLVSTQNQCCFNVKFRRRFNVDKLTLFQRWILSMNQRRQMDDESTWISRWPTPRRHDVVCWEDILLLKDKTIFAFMERFHLAHRQSSLTEGRTFHCKVPFPLNFISLKILQWVKPRTRMCNAL